LGTKPSQAYLLQTDQVDCYGQDGHRISCDGAGQDASFEKKYRFPSAQRFKILDRVVKDTLTGAVWSKHANPAEFPLTWDEALTFVADLRASRRHGYDDWQLPPRRLLFALLSHQHTNPALPHEHPFDDVFPGYYWCRESCRRLETQAWYVHLGGGRVHRGMKHGSYMVWPVSPGAVATAEETAAEKERFILRAGCVHDSRTGLTWSRNADPAGGVLTWQRALSLVGMLNRTAWEGSDDWRMPNIRELESLICLASHSPALPQGHPFIDVRSAYWSSTTSVYEARYAWALYAQDGIVGVAYKPGADFHLWPVRGG
jgi:hypothetical protein